MSESFEKAAEAAAILSCATFDQDRIWHNLLGEDDREEYRKEAAAMLRAAIPHLTAQDVPHVAREAWDEGAQTAWDRSTPIVNGQNYHWRTSGEPRNPYAEEADHEHRA